MVLNNTNFHQYVPILELTNGSAFSRPVDSLIFGNLKAIIISTQKLVGIYEKNIKKYKYVKSYCFFDLGF